MALDIIKFCEKKQVAYSIKNPRHLAVALDIIKFCERKKARCILNQKSQTLSVALDIILLQLPTTVTEDFDSHAIYSEQIALQAFYTKKIALQALSSPNF